MLLRRRMMGGSKKSILPTGYTQVEYIDTNKGAYINTNIAPNDIKNNPILITKCSATNSSSTINFGRSFSASYMRIYYSYTSSWAGIAFGSGTRSEPTFASGHSRTDLKLYNKIGTIKLCLTDGIPSVYLDDELIGSWPNNTSPTFNVTPVMYIGDGSLDTYARFYSFIIADGDDIKFNGIPCISPDNVVGMYDLVTESFFGNAGGTEFISGNPV